MSAPSVIDALDPVPNQPRALRVRAGGRLRGVVPARVVTELKLEVGRPCPDELIAMIERAVLVEATRRRAAEWIDRRALSRAEVETRLVKRELAADVIAAALDQLTDAGLLDDAALARQLVDTVRHREPVAPPMLESRLRRRGVDEGTIDEVIAAASGSIDALADAEQIADRRARSLAGLAAPVAARRLASALARRGFDQETVEEVLRRRGLLSD